MVCYRQRPLRHRLRSTHGIPEATNRSRRPALNAKEIRPSASGITGMIAMVGMDVSHSSLSLRARPSESKTAILVHSRVSPVANNSKDGRVHPYHQTPLFG